MFLSSKTLYVNYTSSKVKYSISETNFRDILRTFSGRFLTKHLVNKNLTSLHHGNLGSYTWVLTVFADLNSHPTIKLDLLNIHFNSARNLVNFPFRMGHEELNTWLRSSDTSFGVVTSSGKEHTQRIDHICNLGIGLVLACK